MPCAYKHTSQKRQGRTKDLKVLSFTVLTTFLDPPYPPSKKQKQKQQQQQTKQNKKTAAVQKHCITNNRNLPTGLLIYATRLLLGQQPLFHHRTAHDNAGKRLHTQTNHYTLQGEPEFKRGDEGD